MSMPIENIDLHVETAVNSNFYGYLMADGSAIPLTTITTNDGSSGISVATTGFSTVPTLDIDIEALIIGKVVKEINYIERNNIKDYKISYFFPNNNNRVEFTIAGQGKAVILECISSGELSTSCKLIPCTTEYQNFPKDCQKYGIEFLYACNKEGELGEYITKNVGALKIGDLYS